MSMRIQVFDEPLSLMACFLTGVLAWPMASAQTIQAVTETTPYTYLQDGRVVGSATEVVEDLAGCGSVEPPSEALPVGAGVRQMALNSPNVLIFLIAGRSRAAVQMVVRS